MGATLEVVLPILRFPPRHLAVAPPPQSLPAFRWDSLLRCGSRVLGLSLSEVKMLDFCDALLRNNPVTGNFGSLVALTVAAVDEVRRVHVSLALCALCLVDGVGRGCFLCSRGHRGVRWCTYAVLLLPVPPHVIVK